VATAMSGVALEDTSEWWRWSPSVTS